MDDKTLCAKTAPERLGGSLFISNSLGNIVEGVIRSQHMSHLHTTVRLHAGRRIDMRIKLPMDDPRCFLPGQAVIAVIPAEAVRLEAGWFRRSRQRLNRWCGRLVLTQPLDEGQRFTAKLHGEGWTLTGTIPVLGFTHVARTWDMISIVVDPSKIELFSAQSLTNPRPKGTVLECRSQ